MPNTAGASIRGIDLELDGLGFAVEDRRTGVYVAGISKRPMDVASTVRDATGAALKAARNSVRG